MFFIFYPQLICSRLFSGKSDADICSMFSDRTLMNRRNVTGDTHLSYGAIMDFFSILFTSRIIAAAMSVLGFANKSGALAKHTLPKNLQALKKAEKLDCLREMSAKVVDEFVFQHSAIVNDLVNHVVTG